MDTNEEYVRPLGHKTIHQWLKRHYGKATKCESSDCSGVSQKFEWSKLKDKPYFRDRNNFWQLCRSCHAKYDFTEKGRLRLAQFSRRPRHLRLSPVYQKDSSGKVLRRFNSIKEAAKHINVNPTAIRSVLLGLSNTSGGYGWERAMD